jgi:hypothetical protein
MVPYVIFGTFGQVDDQLPSTRCCLSLEPFRNYCELRKIARCGFPWEKTTKRPVASVHTNCETALAHFHFYSAQEGAAKCVFSWGKAASKLVALYAPEVKLL